MLKKRKFVGMSDFTLLDADLENGIVYAGDTAGNINIIIFRKPDLLSKNGMATLTIQKQCFLPEADPNETVTITTKLQETNISENKKNARFRMIGQRRIRNHTTWYIENPNE
jgi:hypothetical protein